MPKFSDDQIRDIVRGTKDFRTIPFPTPGGAESDIPIAVRCLSEAELDGCRIEAQRRMRDLCKLRGWDVADACDVDPDLLQRLVERSIVARAFFDSATIASTKPEPFFSGESEVEQLATIQMTSLLRAYVEHQEWTNPFRSLTPEGVEELADTLGKAPKPEALLGLYEHDTLRALCISLASALRSTRPTGKSSTSPSS